MVTSDVIQRIFKIRRGESSGTAFTTDRGGRQYVVTARHVVEGIVPGETIDIWHDERWKALDVHIVGIGEGELDITVLTASIQVSPTDPLEASAGGVNYSQPVYLLGFPYGRDSGGTEINRGLPIPFVKSGIVSAMEFGDVDRIYIDTHANEGFSGGPVVFHPQDKPKEANELRVAGVVTGYLQHARTVHDDSGNRLGRVAENAGIVVALGMRQVVDLIDANPIGFKLPTVA